MNFYCALGSNEIIYRLGWTLIHTLWIGAAVTAMFAVAMAAMRRLSARARYLAGCLAMVLFLAGAVAAFVGTQRLPARPAAMAAAPAAVATDDQLLARIEVAPSTPVPAGPVKLVPADVEHPSAPPAAPLAQAPAPAQTAAPQPPLLARVSQILEPALPWLVLGWTVGVCVLALWQLAGWVAAHRLTRLATGPADAGLAALTRSLAQRLGVARAVKLLESALVRVPTVIGYLRPVILLPLGFAAGLSPAQVESILVHELSHIRRYDYLINLLQSLVETLLFYHPATWYISRRIRLERENCCDDLALAFGANQHAYAESLLHLARQSAARQPHRRPTPASAGVGATGKPSELRSRVVRVLGSREETSHVARSWPVVIVLGIIIAVSSSVLMTLNAQSANPSPLSTKPATHPATQAGGTAGERRESQSHLTGRVLGPDGKPVASARVKLSFRRQPLECKAGTTDAQGGFNFELDAYSGGVAYVAVMANGFAPALQGLVVVSRTPDVVVRLQKGNIVVGRVVDSVGHPVAGAEVIGQGPWYTNGDNFLIGKTDAEGRFRWTEAPETPVPIFASKDGYECSDMTTVTPSDRDAVLVLVGKVTVQDVFVPGKPVNVKARLMHPEIFGRESSFEVISARTLTFASRDGLAEARLVVDCSPWPKATYIASLELLDAAGQVLAADKASVETPGIEADRAAWYRKELTFSVGPAENLTSVATWRLTLGIGPAAKKSAIRAPSTQTSSQPATAPASNKPLQTLDLAPGDVVDVTVSDLFEVGLQDILRRQISPEGFIDLPNIERVKASGMSSEALARSISKLYGGKAVGVAAVVEKLRASSAAAAPASKPATRPAAMASSTVPAASTEVAPVISGTVTMTGTTKYTGSVVTVAGPGRGGSAGPAAVIAERVTAVIGRQGLRFLDAERLKNVQAALEQSVAAAMPKYMSREGLGFTMAALDDSAAAFFRPLGMDDHDYLYFPDNLRTYQWQLAVALRRKPLTPEQLKAREDQRAWMRSQVLALKDDEDPRAPALSLARLERFFADQLALVFQEPMTAEQFERFQKYVRSTPDAKNPQAIVPIMASQALQLLYQGPSGQIELPFKDTLLGYGAGGGNVHASFQSNQPFAGMMLSLGDSKSDRAVLDAPSAMVLKAPAETAGDSPRVSLETWLKQQGKGDVVYDKTAAALAAVRGAKLLRLTEKRWLDIDSIADAKLLDRIARLGTTSISFKDLRDTYGTGTFIADDSQFERFVAVLSADGKLTVLEVQGFDTFPGQPGLAMRVRHRPAGLAKAGNILFAGKASPVSSTTASAPATSAPATQPASQHGHVQFLGSFARPGDHEVSQESLILRDAIALAGGVTRADARYLYIIPGAAGMQDSPVAPASMATSPKVTVIDRRKLEDGDPRQNVTVHPGDVVLLPTPLVGTFYMTGMVARPGVYALTGRTVTVKMVLAAAGRIGSDWPENGTLFRVLDQDKETQIPLAIRQIMTGQAPDVKLQINDVLSVGTDEALHAGTTTGPAKAAVQTTTMPSASATSAPATQGAQHGRMHFMGAFVRPGDYEIPHENLNVSDALALAGGVSKAATSGYVYVIPAAAGTQGGDGASTGTADSPGVAVVDLAKLKDGNPGQNIVIHPGDLILTPPLNAEFYVMGDVTRPGVYSMADRVVTVRRALAGADRAGKGWPENGTLFRRSDQDKGKESEIPLAIRQIMAGRAPDVPLQPNDVLFVKADAAPASAPATQP